jgi:phosphate transport system permease protein
LILRLAAFMTVVITVGIIIALLLPSIDFFREVPVFEFLFGTVFDSNDLQGVV